MPEMIDVATGEVKIGDNGAVLVSNAIGSCIAIIIYAAAIRAGGIAHIMLPGRMREENCESPSRYAYDGIRMLVDSLRRLGAGKKGLHACIAGGSNVLKRPDDTINLQNIASVQSILTRFGLPVCAASVGGVERRRVRLDLSSGTVYCGIGDGAEIVLWNFIETKQMDYCI